MVSSAIEVSHVNIRTSISFLLIKLVILDLIAASFVLIYFSALIFPDLSLENRIQIASLNVFYFGLLVVLKIALTIFVVLQWLNEYYEISATDIRHVRGIIWRKIDTYQVSHVRSLGLHQGMIGKFLNYGSIKFFDRELRREHEIFAIHNPTRYLNILKSLVENANVEDETVREHVILEEVD